MKKYNFLLLIVFLFSVINTKAQEKEPIPLKLSKDTIILGQHIELSIKIPIKDKITIEFPQFKDTLTSSKIDLISDKKPNEIIEQNKKFIIKSYIITSFDTGTNNIPALKYKVINGSDTITYSTSPAVLFVKPYVLIDTIPVDTIFAGRSGYVLFGKNGFKKEIEQYIPDSIKQSITTDSLKKIQENIKQQLLNIFSSEITQKTGIINQNDIIKIAEASDQKMFIVEKEGILEEFIVPGSVDTVFVNEYDKVVQNQPLYTIYRIKDINDELYNTPFNFQEFLFYLKKYLKKYWWLILLLIFVPAAIIYLVLSKTKKIPTNIFKIKTDAPAHIIALNKLEQIRKEKIWAKGMIKEYHIQITDTIREYLENRFGINALEMTSSETLESLQKVKEISAESINKIKQILELADAVKFAKYQALQNENDLSLENAFDFVNNTKEIEEINNKDIKLEAEIEVQEIENIKEDNKNE